MSDYDNQIKNAQSYYDEFSIGASEAVEQVIDTLLDLEVKFDNQHTELVEARTALEPFATFAANNTDENGWTSTVHREQISTWFGPSEFRAAINRREGEIRMSERDEALLFVCDEAACHEDPMFYEIFTMDDRWSIIREILDAAVANGFLLKTAQGDKP